MTQRLLTHEKYIETLASGNLVRAENTRIISERHNLNTVRANKIALSAYDDKRYILSDGISTLPYGHYRTVNASIFPDSNQDDDDDDDSERNVSEINSTSHHKDQDLDAWLKFFEEEEEQSTGISRARTKKKSSNRIRIMGQKIAFLCWILNRANR